MFHNAIFLIECIEILKVILPTSITSNYLDIISSLVFTKVLKTLSLSNTSNLVFIVLKNVFKEKSSMKIKIFYPSMKCFHGTT